MSSILIKNGLLWNGTRFLEGDVYTEEGVITKLGSCGEMADFVYDASGCIVSPGLVDIHTHMRGISIETFGTHAEMSSFPFGVTAAADASGAFGDKALLDSFMLKNAVFVCSEIKDNCADFSLSEGLLKKYEDRAIGIKVYFDTEITDVRDSSPLAQICSFAREHGLITMVHCSNSPVSMAEIADVLNCGDIITHSFHGGVNNAQEDGFVALQKAKRKGIIIDAGMAGHVHTDFGVLKNAIANGIFPDTISTDITKFSAYVRGGIYGMTMCMSIMRTLGMPEENILKAVTSKAAQALNKTESWGYCGSKIF